MAIQEGTSWCRAAFLDLVEGLLKGDPPSSSADSLESRRVDLEIRVAGKTKWDRRQKSRIQKVKEKDKNV